MNEFIEQCRAEWKRLGVPEPVADEMADELAADLAAAEADGQSISGFLGAGASDPRGFAASWASSRGVVPAPVLPAAGIRRGRAVLVAFTAVAAIVFVGAVLLLATGEPKIALLTTGRLAGSPAGGTFAPPPSRVLASGAAPIEWVLLAFSVVALGFCAWGWVRRGGLTTQEAAGRRRSTS
ncbi:hypothetical protein [Gryllotalpicola protaetiae]|uniref:Uncharacterized protein n=1 Tax=Gryllotalpicola protaetiae TaxID=2419771 RepID=A0A387BQ13_9MICO|nr:hypothetical protein [Gryllotalpicola protaetiae]AYG03056.1 hypothetical protein D7I44_05620 [Gryllotalpicola protaetiae]